MTAGIHRIDASTYHADPAPAPSLSSGIAKILLAQSPKHAWTAHPRLNPDYEPTESKVFDFGRAAHRVVLGAGGGYAVYPPEVLAKNGAASTTAAKEWEAEARAAGLTPIKAADEDRVLAMQAVVQSALMDMGIALDPARSELSVLAEIEGVWCRAMVDNAPVDPIPGIGLALIDFKTCEDANPEACVRAVENYGYDLQWRHYVETWKAATGEDRTFLFIFQEKTPPFEVCVVKLLAKPGHSADWAETATDKMRAARATWRECLRTNVWPGYPRLIHEIGARPFHAQRWQDQAARIETARSYSPATLARAAAWQSPQGLNQ